MLGKKQYTGMIFPCDVVKNFLKGKHFDLCIEIGVFEGQTSNLIANHLSEKGKLICIDPLEDTYITKDIDDIIEKKNNTNWKWFRGQYERFKNNTEELMTSGRIELIRKTSDQAFHDLEEHKGKVDFCFIDGDHRTEAVLLDGLNCLSLCKKGGHIIFDDYKWGTGNFDCGRGIDMFLEEKKNSIEVLIKNDQVLIRKIRED